MRIGILTSSRADYGIYLPLLRALESDEFFKPELLVFGTHLSRKHGLTINQIISDGFKIGCRISTIPQNDTPGDITGSMIKTMEGFSAIWAKERFDLLIALGDRYEMFAAVASSVPFNVPVAHVHGGETTLGAIDNVFRNSITSMSLLHFTSCDVYKQRVIQIRDGEEGVFNVGALSIDNLTGMRLLSTGEFFRKYGIDLEKPTILFTFHPETIGYEANRMHASTLEEVITVLAEKYQIVLTMPNADTNNGIIREKIEILSDTIHGIFRIESFGALGYLSCMKHSSMLLGNSSSGFVEASWFPKPVVNIGDRQKGRLITPNILSCPVEIEAILTAVKHFEINKIKPFEPVYGEGHTAARIIDHIKDFTVRYDRL